MPSDAAGTTDGTTAGTADGTVAGTAAGPLASRLLAALVAAAFLVVASTWSLLSFRRFSTNSWDLAIFEQAVASYADLRLPVSDVKGPGFQLLGDHFSPITALLAPAYRLLPDPRTLLVAQAVLLAISVYVVARLAVERLGRGAGLAVGTAYALSFGLQGAVAVDFHEVAFAAPLLALAGAAWVRRDFARVALWTLPLLLVKEDLPVTVVAVGLLLVSVGYHRWGVILVVAGAVTLALVLLVVVPHFNPGGYDYADQVAGSEQSLWAAATTAWPEKLTTVVATLGITGFLALRDRWWLVVVPTLLWRFVGTVTYYWGTTWHYSLVLMPVVFCAAIAAAGRLREADRPGWLSRWAAHAPAVMAAVALAALPHQPFWSLTTAAGWDPSPRAAAAHGAIAAVPDGATVEADLGLLTHLVAGRTAYWSGTATGADPLPDWAVFDIATPALQSPTEVIPFLEEQHPGTTWELVYDVDGYQVARRQPSADGG